VEHKLLMGVAVELVLLMVVLLTLVLMEQHLYLVQVVQVDLVDL
jgi:hypothetical protein